MAAWMLGILYKMDIDNGWMWMDVVGIVCFKVCFFF